jgi:hypothetical protein
LSATLKFATRPEQRIGDDAMWDRADAMKALERAIASNELQTVTGSPGCDPLLQPLRANPEFLATIRRLGTAVCAANLRWPVTTTP